MLRNIFPVILLLAMLLAGCGGGGGGGDNPGDLPTVTVTISPQVAAVPISGTQQFAATVTGASNTSVTWSVVETIDGGMVTQSGLYTAPMTAGTCHVRATSQADPTKNAVATVYVTEGGGGGGGGGGVQVTVIPDEVVVEPSGQVQFAAIVTGASNTSVTWSVVQGPAGGTITQSGRYTAPTKEGEYNVKATSQEDPTKSATARVIVQSLPPMPPVPPLS